MSKDFVKADVAALEKFVKDSKEAVKEFGEIKKEFERINKELLSKWEGLGQKEYRIVAEHITDNIGNIEDVVKTINEDILKDIIDTYNSLDNDLADYNRHAGDKKTEVG